MSDKQLHHEEPVHRMAYCSVAKPELLLGGVPAMREILRHASAANASNGITGVLLMDRNLIDQWLEGSRSAVRELWAKLQRDPRHHCIVELVQDSEAGERLFPDWGMGQATREEMVLLVRQARNAAAQQKSSVWLPAMELLCELLEQDSTHPDPANGLWQELTEQRRA